jgi:TonB family protein
VAEAPPPAPAPPPPAPEPDHDLKVSGTLGSLTDEEIAAPFQARWEEIRGCYEDAHKKLWYLGGRVELRLRIATSGEPKQVYVSSSTMGSYEAERCLVQAAQKLRFAAPHGGPEAEFTYPIEFRARAATEEWDASRVSPGLARHRRDVAACRARAPSGLPAALTMTLYVAPGGKITSAGLSADAPLADAFATCLVEKTRAWRLDDPLGRIAKATVSVGD